MLQRREASFQPCYFARSLSKPWTSHGHTMDVGDTRRFRSGRPDRGRQVGVLEDQVTRLSARCLIFEPANVLYDESSAWRWLSQLLGKFDVHTPFDAFYCLWRHDYLPRITDATSSCHNILNLFLTDIGLRAGQRDELIAAFLPRWQCMLRHPRVLPRTHSTLNQLARMGLRLAVWQRHLPSMCDMARQLSALGLGSLLTIVPSDELGSTIDHWTVERVNSYLKMAGDEIGLVTHDPWTGCAARDHGWETAICHSSARAKSLPWLTRLEQLPALIAPESLVAARAA